MRTNPPNIPARHGRPSGQNMNHAYPEICNPISQCLDITFLQATLSGSYTVASRRIIFFSSVGNQCYNEKDRKIDENFRKMMANICFGLSCKISHFLHSLLKIIVKTTNDNK
ncbi:hypothetical protein LOAG_02367 [Loa loa]|uniref:Uncharacterized protein n=1 Tax=Loa loa TaxID=7209 RepID=A0A1S0U8P8_LOALO|nr:hypothetical protein LOAG_02367 [Loa loa]EFO26114.1 hypothetical protein LOAG_02367 [Loa loa]